MTAVYLESSALLTWLLGEKNSDTVRSNVDAAEHVLISALSLVESRRALLRAEHQRVITAAEHQWLLGLLSQAQQSWVVMEISAAVQKRAVESFPAEPIRTLDAIHLATALLFARAYRDLRVLTFDARIIENCRGLGLRLCPTEST